MQAKPTYGPISLAPSLLGVVVVEETLYCLKEKAELDSLGTLGLPQLLTTENEFVFVTIIIFLTCFLFIYFCFGATW